MKNENLVPELRFPDFNGYWKRERLGDFTNWKSGGTPSKNIPEYWGGDIPWISASSMIGKYLSTSERTLTQKGLEAGSRISPKGSLLLLVRGSMLFNKIPIGIAKIDVAFNQDLKSLIPSKEINNNFLYEWFIYSQHKLLSIVVGTGIGAGKLDTNELKSLPISLPNLLEQKKIASFLTVIDKRIKLLEEKKIKLEQYKKGVMQQLFNQDIRFKDDDGKDFPDWDERRLGEVCTKQSSNISANSIEDNDGDYKIYGASGYLQNIDFYREEEAYISIVKDGAGVGRILLCEPKSSVLGTLEIIKPKDDNHLGFLFALLSQIRFTKYITGSTIPHIYFKDYSKEKVDIPHPDEQKKIADFLSYIEESINKISMQIDRTIEFKKGLLQKMFV
ncbi:restriction endonuclease subunit S [Maribacter litoralis]|uniref:restriction endonuclease subunit S n=1 Tax=Maribacter litoralis TaxID=2059726 RepID=UPI003F5CC7BE